MQQQAKAVVLFAGDSGDGIQLMGQQLAMASAYFGNSLHSFADFPAEIRAPLGTVAGISCFQLQFAQRDALTAGDLADTLVAFNAAALKKALPNLAPGGVLIVDADKFSAKDLTKAELTTNPLDDNSLANYRVIKVSIGELTQNAITMTEINLPLSKIKRCKNFFALGLVFWLYSRDIEYCKKWIREKFTDKALQAANLAAFTAGVNYAETAEIFSDAITVSASEQVTGSYRYVTGNEAIGLACLAASELSSSKVFVAGYPITPASTVLHFLSKYPQFISLLQAEDEVASICAAIGAAYGGSLALTITSGPGFALKTESLGFGVMAELPLVLVNVQRAGPSTGMPTKGEQGDLFAAMFGRPGEAPVPVMAANGSADCFATVIEAFRLAVRFMTPVVVLSDAWLASGAEIFAIPELAKLAAIKLPPIGSSQNINARDPQTLAKPWIIPGEAGKAYRLGSLERDKHTGNISYEAENHAAMIALRQNKVAKVATQYPATEIWQQKNSDVCIISWGSSFGPVRTALLELAAEGYNVAHCQLKYLWPLPEDLAAKLKVFSKLIVAEANTGQLAEVLQAQLLRQVYRLNKVTGQPFLVTEIKDYLLELNLSSGTAECYDKRICQ